MSADDPIRRAQQLSRPELVKRFYGKAEAAEAEDGFAVHLDGRPLRTPARTLLVVPSRPLAEALAAEWAAQGARIDPASMPLTRIVNSALDGVAREMETVRGEIVRYAGSDMLCYRAEGPARLVRRQAESWDPVLAWAREELGVRLVLGESVMFVSQPEASLAAVREALAGLDALRLAALHVMTALTGSALIALAVMRRRLDIEAAWAAAHIDEDWTAEQWGTDAEAAARRAARFADMRAAATLAALAG